MYMAVTACDEVRTEIAVTRTEDDLVMLGALDAVLHHVAVDDRITVSIFTLSLRSQVHSLTAQTHQQTYTCYR